MLSARPPAQSAESSTVSAQGVDGVGGAGVSPRGGAIQRPGVIAPTSSFAVTFDYDGGGSNDVETVDSSNDWRVHRPANPSKPGCFFAGWFRVDASAGSASVWDFSQPVTANMTLRARWDSFSLDSGDRDSSGIAQGTTDGGTNVRLSAPGLRFSSVSEVGNDSSRVGISAGVGVDGSLYWWGGTGSDSADDSVDVPTRMALPSGEVAVAASAGELVLMASGAVYWWPETGKPVSDRVSVPGDRRVVDLSGNMMLCADGTVFVRNNDSWESVTWHDGWQPGRGGSITQVALPAGVRIVRLRTDTGRQDMRISANALYSNTGANTLALGDDGSVYGWGPDLNHDGEFGSATVSAPDQVVRLPSLPGGGQAVDVSPSLARSSIVGADGNMYVVGQDVRYYDGNRQQYAVPTLVAGLPADIARVVDTWGTVQVLTADGARYTWGRNYNGSLCGLNTSSCPSAPTLASMPVDAAGWASMAASDGSVCALTVDGVLYGWGQNYSGQLGDGTNAERVAPTMVKPVLQWVSKVAFDGVAGAGLPAGGAIGSAATCPGANVPVGLQCGVWTVKTPSHPRGVVDVAVTWSLDSTAAPQTTVLSSAFRFLASYVVSFNMVGGSPQVPSQRVSEGHAVSFPDASGLSNPIGAVFGCWTWGGGCFDPSTPVTDAMAGAGGMVLTAQWRTFAISPARVPVSGGRVEVSLDVTAWSPSVSLDGVSFDGADGSAPVPTSSPGASHVTWEVAAPAHAMASVPVSFRFSLGGVPSRYPGGQAGFVYATATPGHHVVVFDVSSGRRNVASAPVTQPQLVADGGRVRRPRLDSETPAQADSYPFCGWRLGSVYGGWYDFSAPVTSDLTLAAVFDPVVQVTGSGPVGGGNLVAFRTPETAPWIDMRLDMVDFDVAAGGVNVAAGAPVRDGSDPRLWRVRAPAHPAASGSTDDVKGVVDAGGGDRVRLGHWVGSYSWTGVNVGFDPRGGTWPASGPKSFQTSMAPLGTGMDGATGLAGVDDGSPVRRPADPVRDGYVFTGWFTSSDTLYDFTQPVTVGITLHAGWGWFAVAPSSGFSGGGTNVSVTAPQGVASGSGAAAAVSPGLAVSDVWFGSGRTAAQRGGGLTAESFDSWGVMSPSHAMTGGAQSAKVDVCVAWSVPASAPAGASSGVACSPQAFEFTQVTVSFSLDRSDAAFPAGHTSDGADQAMARGALAVRPETDPVCAGMEFDGWYRADGSAFDFSRPVLASETLTARFSGFSLSPASGPYGGGTRVSLTAPQDVRFVSVAGGYEYYSLPVFGVTGDGKVYQSSWGPDGSGKYRYTPLTTVDFPSGVKIRSVSAASATASWYAVALAADGSVWAWGNNGYSQLGDGTTTSSSSPVRVHLSLPTGVKVRSVSAGGGQANGSNMNHVLAVLSDGTMRAWGSNASGELGDGTTTDRSEPVKVELPGNVRIVQASAGAKHSLAVDSDGMIWAWGSNRSAQVTGDGMASTTSSSVPAKVSGIPADARCDMVAAGGLYSLAVAQDGRVYGWGNDADGELGNSVTGSAMAVVQAQLPAGVKVVEAQASSLFIRLLASDGSVYWCGMWDVPFESGGYAGKSSSVPKLLALPQGTKAVGLGFGCVLSDDGDLWYAEEINYDETMLRLARPVVKVTDVRFNGVSGSGLSATVDSSGLWHVSTPAWSGFPQPLAADVTFDYTTGGASQPTITLPHAFTYMLLTNLPFTGGRGIGPLDLASLAGMGVAVLGLAVALLYRRRNRTPPHASATHAAV